jgi:hypothetical protein
MTTIRRKPPRKLPGQQRGPRTLGSEVLDVRSAAPPYFGTEKRARGMVARGLVPYHRMGGRIIFIKAELEEWLRTLPGVTLEEAVENLRMRGGGDADG